MPEDSSRGLRRVGIRRNWPFDRSVASWTPGW